MISKMWACGRPRFWNSMTCVLPMGLPNTWFLFKSSSWAFFEDINSISFHEIFIITSISWICATRSVDGVFSEVIYQLWPKFRGFGCETVLFLECITAVVTCMMVEIFIVSWFDFRINWIFEEFEIVVFVQRVLVWLAWFQNCWLDQDTRWMIIKMSSPPSKRRTNRESPMQRRFSF